jgi:penicillin-binding protein 1C
MQAASEKYFHRSPEQLSWAEAAFLAILPNAPALKNRQMLKEKRDGLLKKLHKKKWLNDEDYLLAVAEPLPEKVASTESIAPHLMTEAVLAQTGKTGHSTIDRHLQKQVNRRPPQPVAQPEPHLQSGSPCCPCPLRRSAGVCGKQPRTGRKPRE